MRCCRYFTLPKATRNSSKLSGPVIRFCGLSVTRQWKKFFLSLRWAYVTERSNSMRFPLIWKNIRVSCS